MSKKLILSQSQIDRLTEANGNGDYIEPESEVGAIGHNQVALEPSCDMDLKDKERDSDVKYKPLDTDTFADILNKPEFNWGYSGTRRSYNGGYSFTLVPEVYTKEQFEKMALDETNKQLEGMPMTVTLNTPKGEVQFCGDENQLSTQLVRAKKSGNKELSNAIQKTLDKERDKVNRSKKIRSKVLGMQGQYRNDAFNNVYGTNN